MFASQIYFELQSMSEQLKISTTSNPLLQTRHTSFQPTVCIPLRDYHDSIIYFILHEGNNVCLRRQAQAEIKNR